MTWNVNGHIVSIFTKWVKHIYIQGLYKLTWKDNFSKNYYWVNVAYDVSWYLWVLALLNVFVLEHQKDSFPLPKFLLNVNENNRSYIVKE